MSAKLAHLKPCKASPARIVALKILLEVQARDAYATELVHPRLAQEKLSEADSAFATKLVLGVVMTQGNLDERIYAHVTSKSKLDKRLLPVLRLATYEICFLGKEAHVAVHEGVELAKAILPRAAGFVNAVLRRVVKDYEIAKSAFNPDNEQSLADTLGYPVWMVGLLQENFATTKELLGFLEACNVSAPVYICLNSLRGNAQEAYELLCEAGAELKPLEELKDLNCDGYPLSYQVKNPRVLAAPQVAQALDRGKVIISDGSAQIIAAAASKLCSQARVLEIGAGRGIKTFLVQNFLSTQGPTCATWTSVDVHAYKARLLQERAQVLGMRLDDAIVADATQLDKHLSQIFDVVILDAPCSGLGTLRRHPEIRWSLTKQGFHKLCQLQAQLITQAAARVANGGYLVYATCSIAHQENQDIIQGFLDTKLGSQFEHISFSELMTGKQVSQKLVKVQVDEQAGASPYYQHVDVQAGYDGHFCSILRRREV